MSVLSALGGWAVGRLADATVASATDHGPIAVDTRFDLGTDVMVHGQPDLIKLAKAMNMAPMGYDGFVAGMEGTYTGGYGIILTIYGTKDAPVLIRGINAVEVACARPSSLWTLLKSDHGGGATPLPMSLTLSDGKASQRGTPDGDWNFPRQVSTAEADLFEVYPSAPPAEICTFVIEVDYTYLGSDAKKRIDSNGMPFRIADAAAAQNVVNLMDLSP